MAKISIIVPVYNTERFVGGCIESILNQTVTDFELLLIDDGTKDNSGRICDDYALKDNRIKVIHKENGGVSSARNMGLDLAQGEMVFFIDSDDTIEPDYLEMLMIKDGEDFVQGGVSILENDYLKPVMTHDEIFSDFNRFWMQSRQQWAAKCCLSKKIIDKYHIRYNRNLSMGEDGLFNQIFISKCQVIRRISYNGYYYNYDNDLSASHKFYENRLDQQVLLVEELEKELKYEDLFRLKWDYWHDVLNHFYVKGINHPDEKIRKLTKSKIKETYRNSKFRECIPWMRKHGSLDEKIETYLMNEHLHGLHKYIIKLMAFASKLLH